MEIKVFEDNLKDEYNEFLKFNEESLFYHTIEYKNFLKDMLECEEEYLVAIENSKVVGILPLLKKNGKYGYVYNSLPYYGSNGGILANNQNAFSNLANKYNQIILNSDVASSTIISHPFNNISFKDYINHNEIDERISLITNINYIENFEENKIQDFHPDTRWSIRRAIKNSIEVSIDNSMITFLKEVHIDNMRAINGRFRSEKFFLLIDKYFIAGKDYDIYVAKKDGEVISACLLFYANKTIEYTIPVVIKEYRTYQPLSLIIYQAMIDLSKRGFLYWNWGGTWLSQDGVYKFKKKWGTKESRYFYYININNQELYNSSTDELEREYENFYVIPYNKLQNV